MTLHIVEREVFFVDKNDKFREPQKCFEKRDFFVTRQVAKTFRIEMKFCQRLSEKLEAGLNNLEMKKKVENLVELKKT